MIQVEVAFISVDANIGTPIVFLRETNGDPRRMLPIWIGQAEALAIQLKLKDEEPPRPMTHDLLKTLLKHYRQKLKQFMSIQLRKKHFWQKYIFRLTKKY